MKGNCGPKRTELLTAALEAKPSIERAQLTRIELAPGQASSAHHHPCDVVGIVISGLIRFKLEGRNEVVLHAGDPFFEPRETTLVYATFWLEKLTHPDGRPVVMQLQYAQMTMLNFPVPTTIIPAPNNLAWPHITVSTLQRTFG